MVGTSDRSVPPARRFRAPRCDIAASQMVALRGDAPPKATGCRRRGPPARIGYVAALAPDRGRQMRRRARRRLHHTMQGEGALTESAPSPDFDMPVTGILKATRVAP